MSITFDSTCRTFTLHTRNTSYQMKVGNLDYLNHLYYGPALGDADLSYQIMQYDRGFSGNPYDSRYERTFSLDAQPQEFTTQQQGDFRITAIEAVNTDGSYSFNGRYKSFRIYDGKYSLEGLPTSFANPGDHVQTLEIVLEDRITKVNVVLLYSVFEEADIITRATKVINKGDGPILLKKIMSACIDFMNGSNFDMISFHGRYGQERQVERQHLTHHVHKVQSVRGTSSHQENPFLILCDDNTGEDYGQAYGFALVYSGNFLAEAEIDQYDQTRLLMGINTKQFDFTVEAGESFEAPEVIMTFTENGLTGLTHIYHDFFRSNMCKSKFVNSERPILINTWEAAFFTFDDKKLIEIAKAAKKNVKVKRNLSIVANVISAEVTYSDIEKIEAVEGVKEVVIETQYLPCTDEVTSDAPLMAVTSETMTGAAQSWAEGYTGSGARIAIIDTGLDIDHQSFNNDAFNYAIAEDAAKAGMDVDTYKAEVLKFLTAEEITEAMPYLNAYARSGGKLTASDVTISEKIPYGYNAGSEKQLFNFDPVSRLGLPDYTHDAYPSLGSIENKLVICLGDGSTPVYINGFSGKKEGTIALGSAPCAAITSDDAGHLLLMNHAEGGQDLTIWATSSVTEAPTLYYTYNNPTDTPVGYHVRVCGDIAGDAQIILTHEGIEGVTGCGKYTRLVVSGGAVVDVRECSVQEHGLLWASAPTRAAKVAPAGPGADDGEIFSWYGDNYNMYYISATGNLVTKDLTVVDPVTADNSWGYNYNCLDAKLFNGQYLMSHLITSHFPEWGYGPCLYLYDMATPSLIKSAAPIFQDTNIEWYNIAAHTYGAADVVMAPSKDGFRLFIFYYDYLAQSIGGYTMDCIKR